MGILKRRQATDPATGESRRFLTAPPNAKVTGVVTTLDGTAMRVGLQHPDEDWSGSLTVNSTWPDNGTKGPAAFTGSTAAKPRSPIVVITR